MRIDVDNAILWVKVASKAPLEQPGGPDSCILRLIGTIERQKQRGTIVTTETTHVPIEARGRVAQALDRSTEVGSGLWIVGEHHEDEYADRYGEQQHTLKIVVNYFEVKRKLNISDIFGERA